MNGRLSGVKERVQMNPSFVYPKSQVFFLGCGMTHADLNYIIYKKVF
jgi:hypothetical protein